MSFKLSDKKKAVLHLINGKAKIARYNYPEEDVKEFIRLLKEELQGYNGDNETRLKIDKLAGEELC